MIGVWYGGNVVLVWAGPLSGASCNERTDEQTTAAADGVIVKL